MKIFRGIYARVPWWFLLIPPSLLILGALAARRYTFALLVIGTIANAETATKGWTMHGMRLTAAVWTTIAISSYETFFWFFLFNKIEAVTSKYLSINIAGLETELSRIARVYRWLKRKRLLYLALPIFGFCPKGTLAGITFSQVTRLNQIGSFLLVICGNAAKIVIVAHIIVQMNLSWVFTLLVLFLALPFLWKLLPHKK